MRPKRNRFPVPGSGRSSRFNRPRDWQEFERLTRELLSRITLDVHTDLNGRSGQPQAGVDVSCIDQRRQRIGVQCRGRDGEAFGGDGRVTAKELKGEVAKAKTFRPALDKFVLLTLGPNDSRLKEAAAKLTEKHQREGLFEVHFHGWDWIEARLSEHMA